MRHKTAGYLMILVILLGSATAMAANGVGIDWSVIGAGGGRVLAGSLSLDHTSGQAVAGAASSGITQLCSGFWCQPETPYTVYLPLLHRTTH